MNKGAPFEESGRKKPAPGVHIYSGQPTIVLLTVSTEKRIPWLANDVAHKMIRETWLNATAWLAGDYVLMPDHLHVFCAPHDLAFTIEEWITFWKRDFKRKHHHLDWTFQSLGWHHRLRKGESYTEKWHYVRMNPVRKSLVERPEDWPYQGTIHTLRW